MYTFDAIILEKKIIKEKQIKLTVLSEEYGKITLWHKKPITWIDLGDIARIIIKRDKWANHIRNIEWKLHLINKHWDYENLIAFLGIVKILKNCIAESDIYPNIFKDYKNIIENMWERIEKHQCLLLQMRFFKYLWTLNPDFFENDKILNYIYQNINKTPISKILQSKKLEENHLNTIEKSNLFSISNFI